jgi:hypothetical protein
VVNSPALIICTFSLVEVDGKGWKRGEIISREELHIEQKITAQRGVLATAWKCAKTCIGSLLICVSISQTMQEPRILPEYVRDACENLSRVAGVEALMANDPGTKPLPPRLIQNKINQFQSIDRSA